VSLLVLGGFGLGSVGAQSGVGFSISPQLYELNLEPGQSKSIEFKLSNLQDATSTLTTKYSDFEAGTDGIPKVLSTANTDYGMMDWFRPTPSFSIASDADETVSVNFDVPADAKNQTYYGIALFSSSDDTEELTSSIGGLVFVNVGTPTYQGAIADMKVESAYSYASNDVPSSVEVTVENTGSYKFTPTLAVDINGADDGLLLDTLELEKTGSVLPGQSRIYTFSFDGTFDTDKSYTAKVVGSLPDEQTLEGKTENEFYVPSDYSYVGDVEVDNEPAGETVFVDDEGQFGDNTLIIGLSALILVVAGGAAGFAIMKKRSKAPRQQASQPGIAPTEPHQPPQVVAPTAPQEPVLPPDPNDQSDNQPPLVT